MNQLKVAVVTGSNKGIGFFIVKRLCKEFNGHVYLTGILIFEKNSNLFFIFDFFYYESKKCRKR